MTPSVQALLAEFEAAAKTAQSAEEELRKSMAQEIARLERRRHFAFRRKRLVGALAAAPGATEADAEAEVWSEQRSAVREELDWIGESKAHDAILEQLRPVGLAVVEYLRAGEGPAFSAVQSELEKFEAWFEGAHGKSFYALFDQYVPEVPVVDF